MQACFPVFRNDEQAYYECAAARDELFVQALWADGTQCVVLNTRTPQNRLRPTRAPAAAQMAALREVRHSLPTQLQRAVR